MSLTAINPTDGSELGCFDELSPAQVSAAIERAHAAFGEWRERPLAERCDLLRSLAATLRSNKAELAREATLEMGKILREAESEVEKSAAFCELLRRQRGAPAGAAGHRRRRRARELRALRAARRRPRRDALELPLRPGLPLRAAGACGRQRRAAQARVERPRCALEIEDVFREAGFPEGVFQTLLVGSGAVEGILSDDRVRGVALTGSEGAGSKVAAVAGRNLKRSVLELGGSDPFIVLDDADLDAAAREGCRGPQHQRRSGVHRLEALHRRGRRRRRVRAEADGGGGSR